MIKASGVVFMMSSLSQGSVFKQQYAVLENGKLMMFKNENDYLEFSNTVMKPFTLSSYRIAGTPAEVEKTSVTPSSGSMFSISGHPNLSVSDKMRKDYDLSTAVVKYRFNLVPKVTTMHSKIYFFKLKLSGKFRIGGVACW